MASCMGDVHTRRGVGGEAVRAGARLLKIAPWLFNERFIATVVRPTIADLQSEVAAAGPDPVKRLRARWRGYSAFWTLIVVAPFASWSDDLPHLMPGRVAAGWTLVTVLSVVTLGVWTVFVATAATLVAFVLHAWYERHPSEMAMPHDAPWRSPQINFSSTDIAGNVGGLIFVVGSVVIVSLGLPAVFWFLLAGVIAACFVAWGLVAWHTRAQGKDWTCAARPPRQLL
jgi:hypothetical protein